MSMKLFGINVGVEELLFPKANGGQSLVMKQLSPNIGDMAVNVLRTRIRGQIRISFNQSGLL